MFVPFTLFHVDRHLKKLDNHSQYSVEQIGSDCTRIDLRASVFQKFSGGGGGGGGMPPDPPSQCGLHPHICALRRTSSRPAPLIKNIFLRLCCGINNFFFYMLLLLQTIKDLLWDCVNIFSNALDGNNLNGWLELQEVSD